VRNPRIEMYIYSTLRRRAAAYTVLSVVELDAVCVVKRHHKILISTIYASYEFTILTQ
jgi:hypothetical protein